MRLLSHTLSLRLCGTAFAALAAVVCSAGRASAECGDYVHVAKDRAAGNGLLTSEPLGHDDPTSPRPPCNGPGCSGKPAAPVLPVTAPVTEPSGGKESVARIAADADRTTGSSRHAFPNMIGSPIHIPNPVFDPPRAV